MVVSVKLPVVSGRETIKALTKIGFVIVGRKGSHIRLNKKCEEGMIVLIVPDHRELAVGTLNDILKRAKLSREEFLKIL